MTECVTYVLCSHSWYVANGRIQLANILEDYAQNRRNANPRDQDSVNATMVKLCE